MLEVKRPVGLYQYPGWEDLRGAGRVRVRVTVTPGDRRGLELGPRSCLGLGEGLELGSGLRFEGGLDRLNPGSIYLSDARGGQRDGVRQSQVRLVLQVQVWGNE